MLGPANRQKATTTTITMKMHIEKHTMQEPEQAQEPRTVSGVGAAAEAGTVNGTGGGIGARTGAGIGARTEGGDEVVASTRGGTGSLN